ncbi:MAG: PEGA domain-containing protein, partial [Halobacteria archaeon]|nr:PEGA domain-containing protein [Halobacteria archaeon]
MVLSIVAFSGVANAGLFSNPVEDHHCNSDNAVKHDGEIYDIKVTNRVDKDDDGYASSFVVRLATDSRQSQPRRKGKEAFRLIYKILSFASPGGAPPQGDKWCIDLVPGYNIEVTTTNGKSLLGKAFYPNHPHTYPGSGNKHDSSWIYIGPLTSTSNGVVIPDDRAPGSRNIEVVDRTPSTDRGFAVRTMKDVLGNGDRTTVKSVGAKVCWHPVGHGKISGKINKGCLGPNEGGKLYKTLARAFAGKSEKQIQLSNLLKVESPYLDKEVEVSITSNPSGATLKTLGEKELGTTPWTGKIRVDRPGMITSSKSNGIHTYLRLGVTKKGYDAETTQIQLTPPGSGSGQRTHVELKPRQKPVTVTSEPTNMTVWLDGKRVGTTPWSKRLSVLDSYDVTVGQSPDTNFFIYYNQTFKEVTPTATLHANLTQR